MRRLIATPGRTRAILLAAVAAACIIASAFAYWMASGTGSATTQLGSPEQLTLEPGSAGAQLAPGGSGSVEVVATNPNPFFVNIASLSLDTAAGTQGFGVDAGHSGCDTSAIHFVAQPAPIGIFGQGWRVPPSIGESDGTLAFSIPDALTMDLGAADACQGASFTVHLVAGA